MWLLNKQNIAYADIEIQSVSLLSMISMVTATSQPQTSWKLDQIHARREDKPISDKKMNINIPYIRDKTCQLSPYLKFSI